jgi:hypothetical protein
MDARISRAVFVTAVLLVSMGARYRSANFIVETADPNLAKQFAEAAENYRVKLAESWLGEKLPNWSKPCPVTVSVGPNLGAGGQTSFTFDRGEVFGWNMQIQGSAQRVLDSVLPHEITHMIFASHFRRPLPRWADEGGATSVEHASERNKQRAMLDRYLRTNRGIPFSTMFAMTEYPADILPLYAEGYSTAEYLIQIGGRRKYIAFLDDGLKGGDWVGALKRSYNIAGLGALQNNWLAWVKQGSPLKPPADAAKHDALPAKNAPARNAMPETLASATRNAPASDPNVMPLQPLVPVPEKRSVAANDDSKATENASPIPSVAAYVPYTPGSTIAVSRLSITSTGWRSTPNLRTSTSLASASTPTGAPTEPYRDQVGRPQPLESPVQTTMWR